MISNIREMSSVCRLVGIVVAVLFIRSVSTASGQSNIYSQLPVRLMLSTLVETRSRYLSSRVVCQSV